MRGFERPEREVDGSQCLCGFGDVSGADTHAQRNGAKREIAVGKN